MISKAVLPNLWHRSPGPLNFSPGLIFRGAVGSTGGFLEAGLVVGVGGRGEGGIGAGKEAQGIVGWGLF